MSHHLIHLLHNAHHADQHGDHKAAGVAYITAGVLLTPFLIGIPITIWGVTRLFK